MIQAINSTTNFKGIYQDRRQNFSNEQRQIIKDIKNKLADRTTKKDFLLEPFGKTGVSLYEVSGKTRFVDGDNGENFYYAFENKRLIANCDEKAPFDIKNFERNNVINKNLNGCLNVAFTMLIGVVTTLTILGLAKITSGKSCFTKNQTEIIQKTDTLRNNIIKQVK